MDILYDFTLFVTDIFITILLQLDNILGADPSCIVEIDWTVIARRDAGLAGLVNYAFHVYTSSFAPFIATVLIGVHLSAKHYNDFITPYTTDFARFWAFLRSFLVGVAIIVITASISFSGSIGRTAICRDIYQNVAIGYAIFVFIETVYRPTHRNISSRQGIGSFHLIHYLLSNKEEAKYSATPDRNLFERFGFRLGQAVDQKTEYLEVTPVTLTHYHELSGKNKAISLLFRIMLAPIIALSAGEFFQILAQWLDVSRSLQVILAVYLFIDAFNDLFLPVISVFYGPIFVDPAWVQDYPILIGLSWFTYFFILFAILMRGTFVGFLLPFAVFVYACCMTTFLGYFSVYSPIGFFSYVADLFNRVNAGSGFMNWMLQYSVFNQVERELRLIDRTAFFPVGSIGLIFWWGAFFVVYYNVWHTPSGRVTYGGQIRLPEALPAYGYDKDAPNRTNSDQKVDAEIFAIISALADPEARKRMNIREKEEPPSPLEGKSVWEVRRKMGSREEL